MDLFSSKRSIVALDWWKEFDSSSISAISESFFDSYINVTLNTLENHESINKSLYKKELLSVRYELICLAHQHLSKDEQTLSLENGLKSYCINNQMENVYDGMAKYNGFIANVASKWVNPDGTDNGEVKMQLLNMKRMDFFNKYASTSTDLQLLKLVARIGNRLQTFDATKNNFLFLSLANFLMKHTEVDKINGNKVAGVLFGFYSGASQALKKVKIQ